MTTQILPLSDAYRGAFRAVSSARACAGLLPDATCCPLPGDALPFARCAAHDGAVRLQQIPLTPGLAAAGKAAGWLYPTDGQTTELAVGFLLGLMTAEHAPRVAYRTLDEWTQTLSDIDQPTHQRRWGKALLAQWPAVLAAFTAARQVGNPRRKNAPECEPCTRCGDPEARYRQAAKRPLCDDCAAVLTKTGEAS